jgi:hypothetical protein
MAHEPALSKKGEPEMVVAALQRTCLRVSENLCDALGQGGCSALLGRALARTGADHPALNDILQPGEGRIDVDGVASSVEAHGVAAVTAAIEALLAALVESLGRLIGEEMAVRLMDHDPSRPENFRGKQAT